MTPKKTRSSHAKKPKISGSYGFVHHGYAVPNGISNVNMTIIQDNVMNENKSPAPINVGKRIILLLSSQQKTCL